VGTVNPNFDPSFATTRDEYIKLHLTTEMRRHRGSKRLRKKKAKQALRLMWGYLQMGRLLASRRINYSEIGRKLVVVEPLPEPVTPIYAKDIAEVVTGVGLDAPEAGE
jgi:hypothetical protein